ncbi:hypothetical protein AB0I37_05530 [Micromonospora purpureochromogenes]|uniref:hypothetical protein n=1 Tax=Micromonospora purpureochromogenes TaxID=47872 RepID=UPI00340B7183
MRRIRSLLGALVAGACATAVLPGVALAAPTAPYTVLTVDVGDAYGKPVKQSGVHDGTNSTVTGRAYGTGGLSMGVSGLPGGSTIAMWITPPVGQSFTAGRTYQTSGSSNATHAGLDMSSDSTGCNGAYSYGSLTVREIAYDAGTGAATAFAGAYEFHCSPNAGAVTGELRWNSSLDYVGVVSSPAPVDFGRVAIGGTTPSAAATFLVKGTLPGTFDAARISGANASSFSIVGNGCSGRTVTPGNFCRVVVAPKALRWGDYTANLELADNSAYGKRVVPLKFTAYDTVIGMYYPLAPQRLLDTRTGRGPIGADMATELQVAGRGGVPASGVGSVVLNVTVTGPTANSFLTLYPSTESTPTASSINFPAGWLGSNNVTVKLGPDGKIMIYNRAGSTHVVVDVVGFYAASDTVKSSLGWGGHYLPVEPTRLVDTRPTPLAAGQRMDSFVDFGPASPRVKALVLNITAVQPAGSGFLSAWSGVGPRPISSTVNYAAGKVVPNLAIVQTGQCTDCNGLPYAVPTFTIYTSQVTNMVVDLVGVVDDGSLPDGLRFTPLSPTRIADSRSGLGTNGALGAGEPRKITAPSAVVTQTTEALAMNVTAVAPTKDTVITVWPADTDLAKPGASNLNPAAGQVVSNAVLGGIGPLDAFNVHNLTGSVHLVADVVGKFYLYSGTASTTALAGRQPLAVRGTGVPG